MIYELKNRGSGSDKPDDHSSTWADHGLLAGQSDSQVQKSSGDSEHPSHLARDLEIAGAGIAAGGLLIAALAYEPLAGALRVATEGVFGTGSGEAAAERMAQIIPKYPGLGMDGLVTKITTNLNQGCLTPETFNSLVGSVPPADSGLAKAIAEVSLPNASDTTLMHSLRDMGKQLEGQGVNLHTIEELTSANPASPGQINAYLFRKANGLKVGVHNLGAAEAPVTSRFAESSDKPIFLFDHISDFSPEQLGQLQGAVKDGRQVFLMDTNNFHDGINFTDLAKGTAQTKLQGLVERARVLTGGAGEASLPAADGVGVTSAERAGATSVESAGVASAADKELAYRVLNESADRDAASLGATVIRPAPKLGDDLFRQMVSREKVEAFLSRYSNPAQKRLAAETLADIDYSSFTGIANKTKQLHSVISADAAAAGLDPAKDVRYLVGVDNWPYLGASSGGFVSSIFKEMNALPASKFVDYDGLVSARGAEASARPYVLDDMSHSGEQVTEIARDLRRDHGIGGLSFSTLSALSKSSALKYSAEAGVRGPLRFLPGSIVEPVAESSDATIKSLSASKSFFSAASPELEQAKTRYKLWQELTSHVADRKVRIANQLTPYIVSDRTNPITSDFAHEVLDMHQWGFSNLE